MRAFLLRLAVFSMPAIAFSAELSCPPSTAYNHIRNGVGYYEELCEKVLEDRSLVRHGPTVFWYDAQSTAKRAEGAFEDGLEIGAWTEWYRNGQRESEVHYEKARLQGVARTWYPDGKIQSQKTYKEGRLDGVATEWHPNGKKRSEVNYRAGRKEGRFAEWFESGAQKLEKYFAHGVENGPAREWARDGRSVEVRTYINGVVVHFESLKIPASARR